MLHAYSEASPLHHPSQAFIQSLTKNEDVGLSEFVLAEFYLLLRNPSVLAQNLTAASAAHVIQSYRHHPYWQILGYGSRSLKIHEQLWEMAALDPFARRRILDARLALTLRQFGVTHFATCNIKDYEGFQFQKVWNPLEKQSQA
ncbi:MAG: hypothetical protein SH807_01880 [Blastochloris sp.]|nr:hypothetical protein [Blastochloris sp.]